MLGVDWFDLIESLIIDAMASGAAGMTVKLRELVDAHVKLTPDRATWGMNMDDPAWAEPVALPARPAPAE